MPESLSIQKASRKDVPALADLAARAFFSAFGKDNRASDMETYLARAFSVEQMTKELADPDATFHIAYLENQMVGYTKLRVGIAPPSVTGPFPIELERIYAASRFIGKHVGAALMENAISESRRAGHQTIWLGVWKKNVRAVAFYERWGYEIVGEKVFVVGNDTQYDHVMARTIAAP